MSVRFLLSKSNKRLSRSCLFSSTSSSSSSSSSNRKIMKRISYIKIFKPSVLTSSSSAAAAAAAAQPSVVERVTKQILDRPFRAALFIVGLGFFSVSFFNKKPKNLEDLSNSFDGDKFMKGYFDKNKMNNPDNDKYYISITNLNDKYNRYLKSVDNGMRSDSYSNNVVIVVPSASDIGQLLQSSLPQPEPQPVQPQPSSVSASSSSSLSSSLKKKKNVFVLEFNGGITALQVNNLREEVTAILLAINSDHSNTNTNTNDKTEYSVVLKLKSGGGTVTGYGLASAQLARLRDAGIKLTILIDEVAASGGYMMAVTGSEVIAAPFAMIGSIGVVATVPNFSNLLKKWGIVVSDYTAGKYKRTVTPYKKETSSDRAKLLQDLNDMHNLFKRHVKLYRPSLNVNVVSTGEVWPATEAFKRGLIDGIETSDKYLLDLHNDHVNLYEVKLKKKRKRGLLNVLTGSNNNDENDDAYPPGVQILSKILSDTVINIYRELSQGNEIDNNFENSNKWFI